MLQGGLQGGHKKLLTPPDRLACPCTEEKWVSLWDFGTFLYIVLTLYLIETPFLTLLQTQQTRLGSSCKGCLIRVYSICYCLFVWFDSLHLINNLSVIKGRVFLGWTSTKLGLLFLLNFKDTTQWHWWGSNPRPLGLESSTLPLSHCPP